MAFYVPHAQQSTAKAKIEGFQSQNPPSPTATFDPSSLFFSGPVFPDAFRHPNSTNNSMDFTDTLMSMMPNGGDQHGQQPQQLAHPQQQQQGQAQNSAGPPLNLNIPQNIFDMSHFPAQPQQLQSYQQQQHRTPNRDDTLDSPASLQTTQSFFENHGQQQQQHYAPSIPSYLSHRPDTPGTSVIGSPSESANATSPFPTHASHARMHGHRSPSIGPVSHSRSRSRGGTSKPPPTNRNVVGKPKRQSISSTPEEPPVSGLPPPSRPQAILIPTTAPHQLSQEFTSHGLNSLGPHPISPLGMHSTQTAPGAWYVPSSSQSATHPSDSFGGIQDGMHQQSFGQAFQPRSLSLGTSPKPGTSASASVLAGSLGTVAPKDADQLAMDAAQKQAAILNEKRRRRRESHNAVERRRRDNINEKISELSTLLPDCMLDPNAVSGSSQSMPTTVESLLPSGNAPVLADDGDGKETPAMKANKGIILRKSVEYIRYLQQLVRVQAGRNRELEVELSQYRGTPGDASGGASAVGLPPLSSGASLQGLRGLESLAGIDEDAMSMSGLILANLSPEDTTQPKEGSEEEEERGRGVLRGRRGYSGNPSTSVGKGAPLGVRDDSADLESAPSDGDSRERMMD